LAARLTRSWHAAKLNGQDIPLGSRIIAVCDAFDAMTSDRSYRRAMSDEAALLELRHHAGSQFDPAVVETFCDAIVSRDGANGSSSAPAIGRATVP